MPGSLRLLALIMGPLLGPSHTAAEGAKQRKVLVIAVGGTGLPAAGELSERLRRVRFSR